LRGTGNKLTMKIDSHQHFWTFDPVRDSWIDESMQSIQRDFLPADLQPILAKYGIDGCLAIQADQSEVQNDFLLGLAGEYNFIKGVVGWVDLQSSRVDDRLAYYGRFNKLKGIRHVLQGETDRALMLKPAFMNGIRALKTYDLAYDILIFPDQLAYTYEFVKAFPQQRFVIDHIAKPNIKLRQIDDWATAIKTVAQCENVYCKISGMVTEAEWINWQPTDFKLYLDVVFEAFGSKRLMYGSDWPVCNLAGGYDKMIAFVQNYTAKLTSTEQADVFGNNAVSFYKL
jgi:L-fuconolactonase